MLGGELTTSLKALARGEGPTLFMTLLAALVALLFRYTREEDVIVATAVNGRLQAWTRTLIGFFSNILVLRTDVSGEPTFRELLDRVFRTAFEAFYHQELPFQNVVNELNPERVLSNSPLFQVMLVLQDYPLPAVEMPGLSVELLDIHTGTAKFDLTLELQERKGRLVGWFEYDNELFEVETIARMAGHFQTLLEGAVKDPDRRVSELPLLAEAERHSLLIEFNATARPVPEATLPALFEVQVARTPEAVALICEGRELSYGELNARANRLAHHLIGLGVGPECLVGVCLDRSFDMVVALLGILKAGGAYLPLDPDYPEARLAQMLADAAPALVLSTGIPRGRLPGVVAVLTLDAPEVRAALGRVPAHDPTDRERTAPLRPSHPAYVIYTSGSAGTPKGVVVTHAGIPSLAGAQVEHLGLTPDSRVLQFASLNFDASLWEVVMALTTGAALVLLREEAAGWPGAPRGASRPAGDPCDAAAGGPGDVGGRRRPAAGVADRCG